MEIEGADGSKLALKSGSKTIFGRGSGFNTSDRTVSRHQILLDLETPADKKGETQKEPRVSFEVTGKNPVWVRSRTNGEIKVFKNSDKGQLEDGDWLCVSGRIPVWFVLKKTEEEEEEEEEEERDLGSESGAESVDIEDIDPVKEFGFLVIGHEFDQCPNQMIRNIKNWDWFLEEYGKGKDSEDDDEEEAVEGRGRGGKGRKRKKGDNGDDDWTGESEDEIKEVTAKGRKVRRAVYSTRSKDRDKSKKDGGKTRSCVQKKTVAGGVDEDDETLGGFIVEDDDAELEEESELDEEEEEDLDDEDEDEDNGDDD